MPDQVITAGLLKGLEWRCIGPHRGGRVVAVAGHPTDPAVFFFGAVAGGVWKTTDGGAYWENISDPFFRTAAVGALAVAESDPNVIYAGTGETTIRGDVSHGDGVYKSVDGGRTWTNMGLSDSRHIAKIRVHPRNPDLVYVAALGHAWGPNRERGLYRSTDGGESWQQILFRSEEAGAIDLSMDPANPRILYAAFWQVQRSPHSLTSGGPGSSLYKSLDGGNSWIELTNAPGLPTGIKGKIGVAVSPAKPDRVWAIVEAEDGAVFRSDDGGESWQRLSEDGQLRLRAWYYMHLYADPQDAETCWVLNIQCWKSVDGGKSFTAVPTPHGDNHDLWIDPGNSDRMIEGNDGGACVTFNGGVSWSTLYNQPTAQLYHVTTDSHTPYRVYASQQDNTAISIPSASVHPVIAETEWYVPGGGESGYIAIRPDDPNIVFGGAIGSGFGNGLLYRYDHRTKQERNITVWPDVEGMAEGAKELKYRFQWTFPILVSAHDPNVLYVAGNCLFRSRDEGASWEAISDDLTRNDRTKMEASGGPITKDNTGVEVYGTIFALAESPHDPAVLWAGTDDGLVQLSRDAGRSWQNITPAELPEWSLVSIIEPSTHEPGGAYLAATRYKLDDWRPYLFKTKDYGKTWKAITRGIPENDFTRVIRADPEALGVLYAGTETAVYVSFDDGDSWRRVESNLPVAPIHDLTVKDRDLIAATHGRSLWILDDMTPFRQLAASKDNGKGKEPMLFAPRPTVRFLIGGSWYKPQPGENFNFASAGPFSKAYRFIEKPDGTTESRFVDGGKNRPMGVIVTYFLPEEPKGEVKLVVLDDEGTEIREFSSKKPDSAKDQEPEARETVAEEALAGGVEGLEEEAEAPAELKEPVVPKQAGVNRFVWDLRYASATKIRDDKSMDLLLPGPVAVPGTYRVRLMVGDKSWERPLELLPDPRLSTTPSDLQEQFEIALQLHQALSKAHEAVNQIRDMKEQLEGLARRLKKRDESSTIRQAAAELKKKLMEVEEELCQPKSESPLQFPTKLNWKLGALKFVVSEGSFAPTKQQREVFAKLSGRLDEQLNRLDQLLSTDVASFNAQMRELGVPALLTPLL